MTIELAPAQSSAGAGSFRIGSASFVFWILELAVVGHSVTIGYVSARLGPPRT